jgi:hypothetical protein
MHKEIAILFLGLAFLSCSPKNEEGQAGTELAGKETELSNAKIEFEEDNFDFGTINEGDEVSHAFKFTNTGTEPLQIISVNVSCGCTVASKPLGTVAAGASDEIVINFNSTGKTGMNQKSVGVLSNAQNNQETLTFTAKVEPKAGS